jgi:protoporphyrinogen oxidase
MSAPKQVLIVGGGFTGLTAAYQLSRQPGFSVTLLEGSRELGGLAAGFPMLGTSLEKAYHHIFRGDTAILRLVEELGLRDQLMWCNSSVGIYRGGRTYPFTSPLDLLRFKPCGLLGRLRLGLTALYLKQRKDWRGLAGQTALEWMTKVCGRDATETVWAPLLQGKFDRYYESISMAWLWGRIHIRGNSRNRSGAGEQLGYFRGGFATVVSRLESEVRRRNVRIETGARVEQFSVSERSVRVNGKRVPFDYCIFTGPSSVFAALLPPVAPFDDYARRLQSIEYLAAICLVFASEQDLGEYYWVNINEPGAPFLVFLNHTRLVGTSHYQSKHVYYIGAYLPPDGPLASMSDDALIQLWWGYLRQMFPEFDSARVSERHVFRFKTAQHIVDTGYEQKIPAYRTPLPGVFLCNFSQLFPEDKGTNCAVNEGFKIADLLAQEASVRREKHP